MSLDNLDIAKAKILYPELGDSFTYLELADKMGLKGTPHMTRADYQRYFNNRPDLQAAWKKPNYLQQMGGEKDKIAGEINEGAAKRGSLTGGIKGISFQSGDQRDTGECAKENMGGKARSEAGFGCWNFWHEIGRYNKKDFPGLTSATGTSLTPEKIAFEMGKKTLNKAQKRELMLMRWGDIGINDFNKALDTVKQSYDLAFDMEIDDNAAAYFLDQHGDKLDMLIDSAIAKAKGEESWFKGGSFSMITLTGAFEEGESGVYTMPSGTQHALFNDFNKATMPYDFENKSRYYGVTEVVDGVRKETEDYFSSKDAGGWVEHPLYGAQLAYPKDDGTGDVWTYSADMGWYFSNEKHDWIWLEDAGSWVYPVQNEDTGAVWFWANEGGNSTKGEWFFPEFGKKDGDIRLYDANDKVWRTGEEVKGFIADPETGLGIKQNTTIEAREMIKSKYQTDLGREGDADGIANWVAAATDEDGWSEQDEASWQAGVNEELGIQDGITKLNNTQSLGSNWYVDGRGTHYQAEGSNWVYRTSNGEDGLNGWFYDEPDSYWTWNEQAGWLWHDPEKSGNWYYSNKLQDYVWSKAGDSNQTSWVDRNGGGIDWTATVSDGGNANPDDGTPPTTDGRTGPEPGTNIPKRISYDDGGSYYDPEGYLASQRAKLNDLARDLSYEGYDQGLIMKLIKGTEVYKDMMDWATGREDQVAVEGLIDDMVEQVAEVNARKGNIATNLDMFDARGGAMLDPRMTLEEKLAIRTAKPSRPATQSDVNAGLAEEVGQLIRNPDYDPTLSYYFEYRNPETGELETRAFRPDMPGKQTFMQEQERLIDGSKKVINNMLDDMYNPVDDLGNSKFDLAMQKQQNALRDKNIIAGGVDDPTTAQDESLGLYTNEGINALNYVYGDDADSQMGKMQDYNAMQKHLRNQQNYLDRMDAKRDLDISSKIRTAIDDLDPVERARDRSMDRIRLARFGGGVVNANRGGVREQGGLFENQLDPKMEFANLDNVTGYGDTYNRDDLEMAGIVDGMKGMPMMSEELKNNQYAKNLIQPGKVLSDTERTELGIEEAQAIGRRPKYIGPQEF